ncbi:saccharopine dehydrogenase NADP-binding domain-containing protein [Paenibacillus sp. GCM10012307]|uniref:NAD(P)-binding domain-containing protein n=1 Tax=Paenibacillus roseus TaxID=2798579 RepID=A0A934MR34_9BACL|nr:NAD(P)-binding domain-containing protein [Paenibacillus roseus]
MTQRKFAFLVHPRTRVSEDLSRAWKPFRYIPNRVLDWGLKRLQVPPLHVADVYLRDQMSEPIGWVLAVPLSAKQMLELPPKKVISKIEEAIKKAAALGADIIGLGALTSPVTLGGQKLLKRTELSITNGNALTAVMTCEGIGRLIERCPAPAPTIAVIGASGSVGSCLVKMIASNRMTEHLILVARNMNRLNKLSESVRHINKDMDVRTSCDMNVVREADIVVLLTSSSDNLLQPAHLKEGALVLDDTQPRNTDETLLSHRPDIMIVDGAMVDINGIVIKGDINVPSGLAYACLAETMLLALEGHPEHFSIGNPTLEQANYIGTLAHKYRRYGFSLAPFHSFGKKLPHDIPTNEVKG